MRGPMPPGMRGPPPMGRGGPGMGGMRGPPPGMGGMGRGKPLAGTPEGAIRIKYLVVFIWPHKTLMSFLLFRKSNLCKKTQFFMERNSKYCKTMYMNEKKTSLHFKCVPRN